MRIGYLVNLAILLGFNCLFANLQKLDFDLILPVNYIENMLTITTQLFYDIDRLDLECEHVLNKITDHLIDLISLIYLFKSNLFKFKVEQRIKHEDLHYLADLIYDANLIFRQRQSNLRQTKNHFIINLFLQLEQFMPMIIQLTTQPVTRSN